jgi:transglutaminase-like putative cysteine protease
VEENCTEFSSIVGLGQIRFHKADISSCFEEIRKVLERERIYGSDIGMPSATSFLESARFIDSDSRNIREFAHAAISVADDEIGRVVALYRAVRESVLYDPYVDLSSPASYRASDILALGRGYCVGKASLLAAVARATGVPARVGYADVRNHMTSPRLYELIGTDIFLWHSYTDLYVEGRWVKATPAFNASLCDRLGVSVLEFDGRNDSLFQQFDHSGRRHMEYLHHRGTYMDVPFEDILGDFRKHYPALLSKAGLSGDFQIEAIPGEDVPGKRRPAAPR